MPVKTSADVLKEVERRLGRALPASIWEYLVVRRWPDDVVARKKSMEDITLEASDLLHVSGAQSNSQAQPIRREAAADNALQALAEITVMEASQDHYLLAVREMFDYGSEAFKPVGWARFSAVLGESSEAVLPVADEQESIIHMVRTSPSVKGPRARQSVAASRKALEDHLRLWRGEMSEPETEEFVAGVVALIKAKGRSVVQLSYDVFHDCVDCLCDVLSDRYGWDWYETNDFVMSGVTPRMPQARIYYREQHDMPAANYIAMEVNPRLSPREVMALYASVRRQIIGAESRCRPIYEQGAELAVFAAKLNDGRTWAEAMQVWNHEHPDAQFSDPRSFTRDCRESYKRVTGQELPWKNAARPQ